MLLSEFANCLAQRGELAHLSDTALFVGPDWGCSCPGICAAQQQRAFDYHGLSQATGE